jgi:hypothetical protein
VICEQFVHLVRTTGNGADEDVCSHCDSVLLSIDSHSLYTLRILKDTEIKQSHEKKLHKTLSFLKFSENVGKVRACFKCV